MKDITKNGSYYWSEVKTLFRLGGASIPLSMVSLGLILFVAMIALAGWWMGSDLVKALRNESEISVYYQSKITAIEQQDISKEIRGIPGVRAVIPVSASEAQKRMAETLGPEAKVLGYFEQSPFEAYLEVQVQLTSASTASEQVKKIPGVDYVRDNRAILERIQSLTDKASLLGFLIAGAVCLAAWVIVTHIIREGIRNHQERIQTLRLLGAPEPFIATPFLIEGLLLNGAGGLLAVLLFTGFWNFSGLSGGLLNRILPSVNNHFIWLTLCTGVLLVSAVTGVGGSYFAIRSIGNK